MFYNNVYHALWTPDNYLINTEIFFAICICIMVNFLLGCGILQQDQIMDDPNQI